MQRIRFRHEPPSNGWLPLQLDALGQSVRIDASDVPNNPVQELVEALDMAASGTPSYVWWHLEPDGYFMHFMPIKEEVEFKLHFAPGSERSRSQEVLSTTGSQVEILLPFWRFLREFQSHSYAEPHWTTVNYDRILAIGALIGGTSDA